ncbi:MAG TPA: hypothetical protein VGF28_01550 [Thermoanaerobaculia bacterium]
MRNAFVVAIAFALLAACSAPTSDTAEPPAAQQPAATATSAPAAPASAQEPALSQQCTNERYGYTVSYPAGWHTNSGEVIPACSAFDPEPVQVPAQSEMPFDVAVVLNVQDMKFEGSVADSQFERVMASERLTVGGRPALRAEVEATGEGLADRGMRTLRYTIDLGNGRTLTAYTNRTGEQYEAEKEILRRMVETISLR